MKSIFLRKQWLKYLLYSNLWVALSVGAFGYVTMAQFYTSSPAFLAFTVFSTAFTYNYMRFVQIKGYDLRNNFTFKAWVARHRIEVIWLMLIFGILSLLSVLPILSWDFILLMSAPSLISLAYPLSFKNAFSGFTSLRTVPGLKMFLIAATWSYVTVIVPAVLFNTLAGADLLEFAFRIILVLALVIPFDIRDMEYDDKSMRTIPQVFGAEFARQLSMFFILLYQLWVIIRFFFFDLNITIALALLIGVEIGYWLIRFAHGGKKEEYFAFWIEGVPVFSAVLLLILNYIVGRI